MFPYLKENINYKSVQPLCSYTFSMTRSKRRQLASSRLMESSSKEIETSFYPIQLAVMAGTQIELNLLFSTDTLRKKWINK